MALRLRSEAEFKQLQIGDLVTNDRIVQSYRKQERRRSKKAKESPNVTFARQLTEHRIAHRREYELPAYHLTPKKQQQAFWHMDFAILELEPIFFIEIQGGIWRRGGGAHSHPLDILRNIHKQNDCIRRGYTFLQFTSDEVTNEEAIEYLLQVMAEKGWRKRP